MYSQSPFHDLLKECGAVFKDYEEFQYELPAHFGSIEQEYEQLSRFCGCIDFSYYGNLKLTGKHALDFLNRMSTNDLKKLDVNEFTSTVLTNEKGRIIDLIIVYRLTDGLLITTSPANQESVTTWLEKYIIMDDVKIQNLTGKILQLGLIGCLSSDAVNSILKTDLPRQNHFSEFSHDGHNILIASSHQLETGLILIAEISAKESLWNWVMSQSIKLCGTEAYTALRIEQKKPVLRRELSDKYNPLEAGLTDAVSFSKGCYIGQEVIARLDSQNKISKRLVKLKSAESISENSVILIGDKEAGVATSSSYSYSNKQNIALGYVKTEFRDTASPIEITESGKTIFAEFSS